MSTVLAGLLCLRYVLQLSGSAKLSANFRRTCYRQSDQWLMIIPAYVVWGGKVEVVYYSEDAAEQWWTIKRFVIGISVSSCCWRCYSLMLRCAGHDGADLRECSMVEVCSPMGRWSLSSSTINDRSPPWVIGHSAPLNTVASAMSNEAVIDSRH